MKILNVNVGMSKCLLAWVVLLTSISSIVQATNETNKNDAVIKAEVSQFFDTYLDTYNQRFGRPDQTENFIKSLAELIHQPFLMSPPNSTPFYPQDQTVMSNVFDGFVQQLETKGAVKLAWKSLNLQVLSPHKVLANNIGYATDVNGDVVYETVSIYLVFKTENAWKISLFSPYELERSVVLKPSH